MNPPNDYGIVQTRQQNIYENVKLGGWWIQKIQSEPNPHSGTIHTFQHISYKCTFK